MATVAETIKRITRKHLVEDNGLLFCQNVTAVGWVNNTVPDDIPDNKGIEELPTSDVSNSGIVVGAALVGRRPIYVVRYQGFMWYNAANIVNYAAKSKAMGGPPCPVFIRALGMEGGIGPVAGGMHHSMIMHMPGIRVVAPMTPNEWELTWNMFQSGDDPVYCSEHRLSFGVDYEMPDFINYGEPDITIFMIGAARLHYLEIIEKLKKLDIVANVIHICGLAPIFIPLTGTASLKANKRALVVDSDYTVCGAAEHVAYHLQSKYKANVRALGLEHRTAGFAPATDNKTPSVEKIVQTAKDFIDGIS